MCEQTPDAAGDQASVNLDVTQIMQAMLGVEAAFVGELVNALEERGFLPQGALMERFGVLSSRLQMAARPGNTAEQVSAIFAAGFYAALSQNMAMREAARQTVVRN